MKKELYYKLLFTLSIALIPMIISAKLIMPSWCISLFVSIIVVCKLGMLVIKNPNNNLECYLEAINNVVVVIATVIIFVCFGWANLIFAIICSVFILSEEFLKIVFRFKPNSQLIEALNFSCEMFIYLTLGAMIVAPFNALMLDIALVALMINVVVLTLLQGYNYFHYYLIKKNKPTSKIHRRKR